MVSFAPEMALLRDIKDIRDELHIMMVLFQDQLKVISTLREAPEFSDGLQIGKANLAYVQGLYGQAQSMEKHAEKTSDALNALIDLKQKYSNVLEARWARSMAEETSRQGTTLMVFTVVTIIFAPLSFMAAVFSVDIAEFPKTEDGMELGFVSQYIFYISAAVVVPLLLIAFNVTRFSYLTKTFKASVLTRSKLNPRPTLPSPERPEPKEAVDGRKSIESRLCELGADMDATKHEGNGRTKLSLPRLVLCLFIIFPINEIRFACRFLLPGLFSTRWSGREWSSGAGMGAGDEKTHADEDSRGAGSAWKLRGGVKTSINVVFGIFRLAFLPLWLCLLCVEVPLCLVVYGLLASLFEKSPLDKMVRELKGSTLMSLDGE
ncbi:hypothetical protein OQA88_5141 [Cercophora sp. LCS_1]